MRKNLCIVLIILICFATTYTYAEETENQTTNTTTDLQTQRSELQNQLDEANGQLNDVQSNLSENLQQVEKLDNKIETSEQTLAEQESKITELKNNIQNVETELNSVTEKYDKQVELFKKRMVAIYMAGDTQYLDVLLKSSSLSDFISSYYLISQLTEIDENLINDLETKKKTIDLSKTKLENEKKELATIVENQTRTTRTLQNTKKMITGILEIDKGDILIDGKSIKKEPIEVKKQIGLVPDNPDVFLKLKGIEYLNFMADIYEVSTQDRVKRIKELSEKFEINNVLNNKIESYSHGMRQKLIIIGVLLHNPKNWILDEPMTGLDPKSSFELKNMMREHANQKNTVFFSTHILDVAERLCDRIGIIDKGKLLFVGTYEDLKKELKENKSLEELFMEIVENE